MEWNKGFQYKAMMKGMLMLTAEEREWIRNRMRELLMANIYYPSGDVYDDEDCEIIAELQSWDEWKEKAFSEKGLDSGYRIDSDGVLRLGGLE